MRARSVLAPDAASVLEAHLAACEACRGQAAGMTSVDAALLAHADAAVAPSWDRLGDRVRASVRRYRRRTPWTIALAGLGGVAASVFVGAFIDGRHLHVSSMAATFALYLVIMGLAYWVHARRQQRLLEQIDVVAAYRGELERSVRVAERTRWLYPVIAAMQLPSPHVGATILMIACLVGAFITSLVIARRTRRELAEMR